MNIIKLNAIDSTNLYLKKIIPSSNLENYTVVVTKEQVLGRGQMGTVWESERGKNLTFSMLIKFEGFLISDQFYLSMAISLAVIKVINTKVFVKTYIKWPNDILAENDKICGILIENSIKGNCISNAIIGIGLNVNQLKFSESLTQVTSLGLLSNTVFDLDDLLNELIDSIKLYCNYITENKFDTLKTLYLKELYKINVPSMFEDNKNEIFLGKIITVDENGRLVIELENEKTRKFSLKEVKFASLE